MIDMKPTPALLRFILENFADAWAITLPPFGIYCLPTIMLDDEKAGRMKRHENVHWSQYKKMGVVRYYITYIWQYVRYGYEKMPMEIEARAAENA